MSIVHLHLLLNHIPVVGAVLGIPLFGYAVLRRNSEIGKLSLGLFAALAAVSIVVFLTGEPAEEIVEQLPGFSKTITERHEELARTSMIAIVGFGVMGIAALAVFRRRALPRWAVGTSLVITLAVAGLMAATANSGGQIRHSEIRPGQRSGVGDRELESGSATKGSTSDESSTQPAPNGAITGG